MATGAATALVCLPYWLPRLVVGLRVRLFARINGEEGIPIPGELVGVDRFKEVYSHPAADGRSEGAGLSDLFWYWLAPGPEVHQEHLEPGERYDEVARVTRRILARPKADVASLAARCASHVLDENGHGFVRLRDLMMPVWAEFSYELVFGEPCPAEARDLIVGNADDVVTALKGCGLRHMDRRERLTAYLRARLGDVCHPLPEGLSPAERVFYLQGTFFNTAVVQMSEAMTHLLLAIAQHPELQRRLAADPGDEAYLDRVVEESMRRYPLFGIAHRITSAEIVVDERTTLPAGSVLCFNYADFHSAGFENAASFDPGRWEHVSVREANHIPFGVTANRPCPARGIAPVAMRAVVRETLRRFTLASSAAHTRSIPNRGPCLLGPRPDPRRHRVRLTLLRLRDRWENVWRSVVQLVCGTYMVLEARRLRLAGRHFETRETRLQEELTDG
ncbi:cytochrome P450 [Actinomadura sp. DC4]|uniref:cytochrome P450 n=1 Tax=Actinomadura sp. DC4 TaxID=3055069 RepID=UPI0025B00D2D|nr:cytochrome P450 [Actinomadura sp. DC4]MDN3353667.1 cytochrome P450 [Actinomadura sp. DC4]